MKKTALILAFALTIALIPCIGIAANSVHMEFVIGSTNYKINGNTEAMDVAPIIIDGRTLMPVRAVAEGLGAEVSWDEMLRLVTIERDRVTLRMTIDGTASRINNQEVTLDVAPVIIDNRTYMPIRFVAENLYATVSWTESTRTVGIDYNGEEKPVMNTYLVDDETDLYEVKVEVPVFQGIEDITFQIALNNSLRDTLVNDANELVEGLDSERELPAGIKFYYATGCTMTYNENGFISVVAGVSYYSGGAHPNHYTRTFNIDTIKGDSDVTYDDLFKPGYEELLLGKINAMVRSDPFETEITDVPALGAPFFDAQGKYFVIHYSPYEIASYARGDVSYSIPLSELKDAFKPEYAYLAE